MNVNITKSTFLRLADDMIGPKLFVTKNGRVALLIVKHFAEWEVGASQGDRPDYC